MKRILSRYERLPCQAINFNKSNVFFSPDTSVADRKLVCDKIE